MSKVLAEVLGEWDRVLIGAALFQKDLVQRVPGAKYDDDRGWHAPLSWSTCKVLRGVFGDELVVGPRLRDWARREVQERVNPSLKLRSAGDAPGDPRQWPWQRAGSAWLLAAQDALLLDDMGGGKTFTCLQAAEAGNLFPALVVTVQSMLYTWAAEVEQWLGRSVAVATGSAAERRRAIEACADVTVIAWQNLPKHSRLAPYGSVRLSETERLDKELNERSYGVVIADEVHRAKSPTAKQTRALWRVGDAAGRRWGLTGTPIVRQVDDLWPQLRFVNRAEWPSRVEYISRWCEQSYTGWGLTIVGLNPATRDEFDALVAPRTRRVPAQVHRGERPEPLHQVRLLDMPTKQRRQYDQMRKGLITDLDGGGQLIAFNALAQTGRLWQLAQACMDDDERLARPSCKVDALLDLVDEMAGEPLVVFAHHAQLIELCERELPEASWASIRGGVPARERQASIERFQRGELPVMLVQYTAGGVGITLTASRVMAALEDSWSATDMAQAIGRLDRPGQEHRVQVVHFRSRGTIDQRVADTWERKGNTLADFVKDRQALELMLATIS